MLKMAFVFLMMVITGYEDTSKAGISVVFINKTGETIKSLTANLSGRQVSFHNLPEGDSTKPVIAPGIHRHCYIKAITNSDTLEISPGCYVGEPYFTSGKMFFTLTYYKKVFKRFSMDWGHTE